MLARSCTAVVVVAVAIGVGSCAPSSSVAESTPTTGRPAKPHTIGFDEPSAGDTSLTLRWSADADTGGRPLTRFQLMRRQVPGSWLSLAEAATVGASVRKHTFSGLNARITYRIRIRACNGDNDATDCSDWAESPDKTVPQPPETSVDKETSRAP